MNGDRQHMPDPLPPLDDFRGYLRTLAEIQIGTRLQAKVDASGLVQQTLLDAHLALAEFRGTTEAELAAWLRTILANNLLNALRGWKTKKRDARREVPLAADLERSNANVEKYLAAEVSSPSQRLLRSEQAELLADALSRLPDDQRLAVLLKHFHGWTLAEIADHMQRTPGSIAGLLKRGLQELRGLLKRD